jgi:hypothetical protein
MLIRGLEIRLSRRVCSAAPGSHKTICTDHEALCVVAGIAVFGGIVAVMQESGDNDDSSNSN